MPAKGRGRGRGGGGGLVREKEPARGKGKDPNATGGASDPNVTFAHELDPDYKLSTLYGNGTLRASRLPVPEQPSQKTNDKIFLWRGPIETLNISVIVNAADETLLSKHGVSGAIFRRAGDEVHKLEKQCADAPKVEPGNVVSTDGGAGDLRASWIIHAVGPDSRATNSRITSKGVPHMEELLRSCYLDSLDELLEFAKNGFEAEIAFPAISTGDNGFEQDWATPIALSEVRKYMNNNDLEGKLEIIVFCVFNDEAEKAYRHYLPIYFPPTVKDLQGAPPDPKETTQGTKGTQRIGPGGTITRGRGGKGRGGKSGTTPLGVQPASSGNAVSFLREPYASVLEAINYHWPSRAGNVLRMRTWGSDSIDNDDQVSRLDMNNQDGVSYYPGLSRPGRRV